MQGQEQSEVRHPIRLGVNIDHVATLRQARGTRYPDPVQAAFVAEQFHAAFGIAAFGFIHHFNLNRFQTRVCQPERNSNNRLFVRTEPFVGQIKGRAKADGLCSQFLAELIHH